jgi:hypothetical protein
MKYKLALLAILGLAGANAMACYTVYDGHDRVVFQGVEAPVDMSLPLHQALAARGYPVGTRMVFDLAATCTPVSVAQVARPASGDVPANTIRMERSGRTLSPSSAAPLLTDRQTAERQHLPHVQVAGDIVMVPARAAARVDLPTFTVIPADTAVARAGVDTRVLGAGPARQDTVITEMRNPPMTLVERGSNLGARRY